ncbi:MAG TPA: hypothetical protein VHE77_09055 [Dongiaceae bacterium]|nr:hypothetical protein [Dongiaceae bacterium]
MRPRGLIGAALIGLAALLAPQGAMADNNDDDVAAALSGSGGKAAMVAFDAAPFPYHGMIPGDPEADTDDAPFLDTRDGDRRGHTSSRGGIYWEDETYSDRRTLLYIPAGFDLKRPAAIVVFFHGNQATLARDVIDRQQVSRQLAESSLNAVLVAPQFAVDALDSSAGGFWQDGAFLRYLREAALHLARLQGGGASRNDFARLPVILVAYSGGYLPAAYSLQVGGAGKRIRGVVLLDAIYDETEKFAGWIADHQSSAFFFSAFTASSADGNGALQDLLMNQGIMFFTESRPCLDKGDVVFLDTGESAVHADFVSHAWVDDPLTWVFDRIAGFPRGGGGACKP